MTVHHIPVMLKEVLETLSPKDSETILDGTFGAGGYTRAILDSCNCNVISTDRDENVKVFADDVKSEYGDRFNFLNIRFSEIISNVEKHSLDGIVLDLGVSSMQLDSTERGFSFNKEAKLSMAMGRNKLTAYDVVNGFREDEIIDILYKYGDETKCRLITKKIVDYRKNKKIETTTELANIVKSCFDERFCKINPATKTFQAIRIYVNDEINELKNILYDSLSLLKENGRLIVVTFHSLEDGIVKSFLRRNINCEKINKFSTCNRMRLEFKSISKNPIIVSEEEVERNPRSRSAKLRWGIKW